jgi:hypothetical protein
MPEHYSITHEIIRRTHEDGSEEAVRWDDLQEVGIVTTADGPFEDDAFWLFIGQDEKSGCAIPHGAVEAEVLFDWFKQKLPDFDYTAVISATGSIEDRRFVCWQRTSA